MSIRNRLNSEPTIWWTMSINQHYSEYLQYGSSQVTVETEVQRGQWIYGLFE